ncbi:MAG TPA: C10 family peptidase [Tenuifilaceae bacterium]|nr:C10 family peptidase [Tenuifilaceae bacterium]HPE18474.1 C10 family peptidase [Tenuifilaceae bacterium]HPJ46263.1 C10 family peptidase [Tenuifilaceae bacterium]HPQ34340.1 C10 family peptidase [Tenuifilaceae bacterium]HRX68896.1 C10 family peptidase [Tenuifilaceae bacterium]
MKTIIICLTALLIANPIRTNAQENLGDGYLLKTVWGGSARINKYNPDQQSPGCHSTALAQICYYHKLQPNGTKKYVTSKGHEINENFDEHKFNWELFQPVLNDETPEESANEMALYSYYIASMVEKNFGTGSYQKKFHKKQLKKHLNCKVHEKFGYKSFPLTHRKIKRIFRKEINAKRPVYFHYTDFNGGGHSIVIDGYKEKDDDFWVHANFGWGGKKNGWYKFEKDCFLKNTKLELVITLNPKQ